MRALDLQVDRLASDEVFTVADGRVYRLRAHRLGTAWPEAVRAVAALSAGDLPLVPRGTIRTSTEVSCGELPWSSR